jgi:hypothetical protein
MVYEGLRQIGKYIRVRRDGFCMTSLKKA